MIILNKIQPIKLFREHTNKIIQQVNQQKSSKTKSQNLINP